MRDTASALHILISFAAAVATLAMAYEHWYPKANRDGRIAIIFLSSIAGGVTIAFGIHRARSLRKTKYVRAWSHLKRIFPELQRVSSHPNTSLADLKHACTAVCGLLAKGLHTITGKSVAVCIKMVVKEEEAVPRLRVATLCRDQDSDYREQRSAKVHHWVDLNTDFEDLFGQPHRNFFSNCLPWLRDYKNSSFAVYSQPPRSRIPLVGELLRYFKWPLPYKSTIVSAILPRLGYKHSGSRERGNNN